MCVWRLWLATSSGTASEVVPGGRNHPEEDHDVTRLETLSMDEALTCVGQLVAQNALNYLPPLPEALAYEEQVEEPAW